MSDVGKTLFENPLQDWTNDDLLIDDERRNYYLHHYGDLMFVFDWPAMRTLFHGHELPANLSRKRIRSLGLIAVCFGFASLLITAWTPAAQLMAAQTGLSGWQIARGAGVAAALCAVLSLGIGYSQLVYGKRRLIWLDSRMWTERLRHFHFQLIVNNLPAIVAAIGSEEAKRRWIDRREDMLDRFAREIMVPTHQTRKRMLDDEAEERTWLLAEWQRPGPLPEASDNAARLLDTLYKQRFGIQLSYARAKTEPNLHSPATRKKLASAASDVATAILLAATITIGFVYLLDPSAHATLYAVALGVIGTCSGVVVASRVLDEGLQLGADSMRYRWYLASLEASEARFLAGGIAEKVAELRWLEVLAYRETRQFLCAMNRSRFIF